MKLKRLFFIILALYLAIISVPISAGAADGVVISEENFPDPVFREYLLEQYYGADGFLTQEELNGITVLMIEDMGIRDLTGIHYFSELEELDCECNQLTALDVSQNAQLRVLDCTDNQLTELDVTNCSELKALDCECNQLTALDVSQNAQLRVLYCTYNQLTELDVTNCPMLEELVFGANCLTNIDLSRNEKLTLLWGYENQLVELDVTNLPELIHLDLHDNNVPTLNLSHNEKLISLDCTRNQLTELDVSYCRELTSLYCSGNTLSVLDLSHNEKLLSLTCNNCKLTELNIENCFDLQRLYCPTNRLTNLNVSHNEKLTELYCDYNQLTELDVSRNKDLEVLWCGNNPITNLDVSKNKRLDTVEFQHCKLTSVDLTANTSLTNVYGVGNKYVVYLGEDEALDLGTLPGNFDVTKASNWAGGMVYGNVLTVQNETVTYTYEMAPGWSETFLIERVDNTVTRRLAGSNRFDTAIKVADEMRAALGGQKFDYIILANGYNFADALAGSYLSAVKNAPILLTWNGDSRFDYLNDTTIQYVKDNLKFGGTVYILGGTAAVPASIDAALTQANFNVERMDGANRFETNIMILEEAGVQPGSEVLVCTSTNFADSLSASAAAKPILLVWNEGGKLFDVQKDYLGTLQNCTFTVIGGESAVSVNMAATLMSYGAVSRLAGGNRFETSVLVAEKYFPDATTAVLAYAWDFPDGLCGGALAYSLKAPLILTMTKYEAKAVEYAKNAGIEIGLVLGGDTLISDEAVRAIFAMDKADEIIVK